MGGKSLRAAYGAHIQYEYVKKKYAARHGVKDHQNFTLPHKTIPTTGNENGAASDMPPDRICIVGAGVAGMHITLMLRHLGFRSFDIWEASNRVGGRRLTFDFNEGDCSHDYYDIGAMRIADIPAMQTTLDLVNNLNGLGQKITLEPYTYDAGNEPSMYCDQQAMTPIYILPEASGPHYSTIHGKLHAGLPGLHHRRSGAPVHSTMVTGKQSMELLVGRERGDGRYAFTETICDYCDFQQAKGTAWQRLDGGMSTLTQAMQNVIGEADSSSHHPGVKVNINSPVTAMTDNGRTIGVTVTPTTGSPVTTPYAAVFNTTTMGCLERIDTRGLNFEFQVVDGVPVGEMLLTGIRALSYDRTAKIAFKLSQAWWSSLGTDGGVSNSDLPISNVVYPTWNDGSSEPVILMASYSWAQDARRMGSLINDYGGKPRKDVNDAIVTLCLRNLEQLWAPYNGPTFDTLQGMYISHHAYAWSHNPNTAGAFALFGPGQFHSVYPHFTDSYCNDEAISAHHAWISGALDSTYTAFMQYLLHRGATGAQAALKLSSFGGGSGKYPAEVDESILVHKVELSVDKSARAKPELLKAQKRGVGLKMGCKGRSLCAAPELAVIWDGKDQSAWEAPFHGKR